MPLLQLFLFLPRARSCTILNNDTSLGSAYLFAILEIELKDIRDRDWKPSVRWSAIRIFATRTTQLDPKYSSVTQQAILLRNILQEIGRSKETIYIEETMLILSLPTSH